MFSYKHIMKGAFLRWIDAYYTINIYQSVIEDLTDIHTVYLVPRKHYLFLRNSEAISKKSLRNVFSLLLYVDRFLISVVCGSFSHFCCMWIVLSFLLYVDHKQNIEMNFNFNCFVTFECLWWNLYSRKLSSAASYLCATTPNNCLQ